MKILRYLHLIIGLAALLAGLYSIVPFLTESSPIDHMGLLALLTGLINLQQYNQAEQTNQGLSGAVALLASALLIIAACVPFSALLVDSRIAPYATWALSFSIVGVCLHTLLVLGCQLKAMAARRAAAAPTIKTKSPKAPRGEKREKGTVKWFNTNKGFGFISRDSGSDIFVHFRAIQGEGHRFLQEGQRVSYVVAEREKGLQAEQVEVLD
ncbi:MAG: cold shock domain-containing protein [Halopseudomonas sp.]|uniref:cold-shock protein n=1 Tax=Halopseudomonas sp. TaxID=2901191 RepID=UPI00300154FC